MGKSANMGAIPQALSISPAVHTIQEDLSRTFTKVGLRRAEVAQLHPSCLQTVFACDRSQTPCTAPVAAHQPYGDPASRGGAGRGAKGESQFRKAPSAC